ncbi:Heavy-metal resistance [Belliella buryatensis]|uniref:Heavy-metal resistance n=1 Tax=Belliella buryatensis TaxID=1500549 RepID=A0A239DN55_9BACT|nr:periplasmic heavy metal sensor [Belliella buryatensis]SNS33916.1 Heavy-metal resistance [Belliella buryatensis]
MMKKLFTVYLLLLAGMVQGQDLFQGTLFPADLVMKNRDKISLSDQQADKIKAIHSKNAGEFSTLRWDLDAENEKLKKMLQEPKINSEAAQKQMDKILNLENQLKKKQFSNLLAIRGELNEKQAAELASISKKTTSTWVMHNSGRVQGVGATSVKGSSALNEAFSIFSTVPAEGDRKASVVLNGKSSFSGKTQPPLYVISKNGKETLIKELEGLNPSDIMGITVLKDDSAIKLYGEKASNGVVIFKLKEGSNFDFEK